MKKLHHTYLFFISEKNYMPVLLIYLSHIWNLNKLIANTFSLDFLRFSYQVQWEFFSIPTLLIIVIIIIIIFFIANLNIYKLLELDSSKGIFINVSYFFNTGRHINLIFTQSIRKWKLTKA